MFSVSKVIPTVKKYCKVKPYQRVHRWKEAPAISQWHLVRSVWLCYDCKGVWITLSQGYLWSIINELISELAEDTVLLNVGGA